VKSKKFKQFTVLKRGCHIVNWRISPDTHRRSAAHAISDMIVAKAPMRPKTEAPLVLEKKLIVVGIYCFEFVFGILTINNAIM